MVIIAWSAIALLVDIPVFQSLKTLVVGAFGSSFAFEQTISSATPLLLTGLAVAIPLQAGLLVIGVEGAFVIGALIATIFALTTDSYFALVLLIFGGILAGSIWLGLVGWFKLKGIHEAISSLLLTYIALAITSQLVEGVLRDPNSFDKPTTATISEFAQLSNWGYIHVGLPVGIALCLFAYIIISHTAVGYRYKIFGVNPLTAKFAGINSNKIIISTCVISGILAGLAGAIEVGAVAHSASISLALGYGYAGILVAIIARGNMLVIIIAAMLIGAVEAGSGLVQRQLGAPAATARILEGLLFISLIICNIYRGEVAKFLMSKNKC